ncbi:hypothetical protein ACJX0J_024645, partial [Zea mays]
IIHSIDLKLIFQYLQIQFESHNLMSNLIKGSQLIHLLLGNKLEILCDLEFKHSIIMLYAKHHNVTENMLFQIIGIKERAGYILNIWLRWGWDNVFFIALAMLICMYIIDIDPKGMSGLIFNIDDVMVIATLGRHDVVEASGTAKPDKNVTKFTDVCATTSL